MTVDRAAIVSAVSTRLGRPEADVEASVDAAIDYVADDVGLTVEELPADDVRLNEFGLPLLAARIFQDSPLPGSNLSEFDGTFSGTVVPRVLANHLDEYWRHLTKNWGIA